MSLQKWRKWWETLETQLFCLLDTNTTLYQPYLMNITALFVTYLYENQCLQDADIDTARSVWIKRLEGKRSNA